MKKYEIYAVEFKDTFYNYETGEERFIFTRHTVGKNEVEKITLWVSGYRSGYHVYFKDGRREKILSANRVFEREIKKKKIPRATKLDIKYETNKAED